MTCLRLPWTSKVSMDAILIRPGLFTNRDSLDNLLEPFQFDSQDIQMTKKHRKLANTEEDGKYVLIVGSQQYRFMESSIFNYHIYLKESQENSTGRNDIAEMATNQGLCIFGEAIAVRPTLGGCTTAKKVDLQEFMAEVMRVGVVDDALAVFPMKRTIEVL